MTTIISRLFEPAERARDAAASLRAAGFVAREFTALAPVHVAQEAGAEGFIDDTAALPPLAAMTDTGISAEDAAIYRAAIEQGAGLVVVRAPFGTARTAIEMFEEFNPVQADVAHPDLYLTTGTYESEDIADNAAPFSRALGLPILSSEPAPFSRLLGLPVLSRRQLRTRLAPSRPTFPVRLIDEPAPLSRLLGLPVLFHHPAPFSALLRLPVLLRERGREV
jgi:hypothetical protein